MCSQVAILVFDGVEVLDFCGPFEVFTMARHNRDGILIPAFDVALVAESKGIVTTTGGMQVDVNCSISSFDANTALDILVVPGGKGVRKQIDNKSLTDWIAMRASTQDTVASVCTGALLLARAGLLHGKQATTHFASLDWLRQESPETIVVEGRRYVEDGGVFTAAGVSAGIDLALRLVEDYCGREVAAWTARQMEYSWSGQPDSASQF